MSPEGRDGATIPGLLVLLYIKCDHILHPEGTLSPTSLYILSVLQGPAFLEK